MQKPLTERQRQVLEFIEGFKLANGREPSQKEGGEYFGIRASSYRNHYFKLFYRGYLGA